VAQGKDSEFKPSTTKNRKKSCPSFLVSFHLLTSPLCSLAINPHLFLYSELRPSSILRSFFPYYSCSESVFTALTTVQLWYSLRPICKPEHKLLQSSHETLPQA
jgi:hypothetical protein